MIEFFGSLYNWLQQFTNHYLTHCHLLPTGHSTGTILTSNWTVNSSQSHIATDGQSVSLGVEPHLRFMTRYLFLFDSYGLVFVGRPLWREDGSVLCICCWPLPAQSFSDPSPLGFATIFYCLRFEELSIIVGPNYIVLDRTTAQKTEPLPSNGNTQTHKDNTSCNTGAFGACVYCGRCLEMSIVYCWLRICCGLLYLVVP
jgi:hypothetical protein